jgi:thioredoxin 1
MTRLNPSVSHLDQAEFDLEVLQSDRPVLVDFWADWCQPCHMLAPTVDQLAERYGDRIKVTKVDIDANKDLALKYEIRSIPTVLIFQDGEVSARIVGVQPESHYATALDALLD